MSVVLEYLFNERIWLSGSSSTVHTKCRLRGSLPRVNATRGGVLITRGYRSRESQGAGSPLPCYMTNAVILAFILANEDESKSDDLDSSLLVWIQPTRSDINRTERETASK